MIPSAYFKWNLCFNDSNVSAMLMTLNLIFYFFLIKSIYTNSDSFTSLSNVLSMQIVMNFYAHVKKVGK